MKVKCGNSGNYRLRASSTHPRLFPKRFKTQLRHVTYMLPIWISPKFCRLLVIEDFIKTNREEVWIFFFKFKRVELNLNIFHKGNETFKMEVRHKLYFKGILVEKYLLIGQC